MAEDHRRVEPRGTIVGTGMATEPDSIRLFEDEKERKQRQYRKAPERGFGAVLEDAPARGALADDEERPPPKDDERPAADAAMAAGALRGHPAPRALGEPAAAPLEVSGVTKRPALDGKALPRVAPDPREAALRKRLAQALAAPKGPAPTDTPPTGNHKRKPP